ncbi:MAG: DUF2721 domain-containing protein [Gammaproteobacteria bacterium]|jgi:hypothetical protein|nr:DUF2721 domain-containing protein [Gammaproteobacteria bacterium]
MVDFHLTDISRVVQLVLAPAFVVAGIGTFVTILTQRLARVVDQWVKLDEAHPQREVESVELGLSRDVLSRRAQLIRRAILLCTFAAIIICSLIGLLFVDAMTRTDLSVLIALVFVLAMTALIGGLIYFLREIHLATAPLRARLLR